MDDILRRDFNNMLTTQDANARYESFQHLLKTTNEKVDWAYEVWNDLLEAAASKNNHLRTLAVQLLSNLAKSDNEHRLIKDIDKLIAVTKDEKFVTARHSLLSLWKAGIAYKPLQQIVTDKLEARYNECETEKNYTLLRYDIITVIKKIFDHVQDEGIKKQSFEMINREANEKYKIKYASVWKDVLKGDKFRKQPKA